MAEAYLALGSNLGDRRQRLRRALGLLAGRGVTVLAASSLYESAPMYVLDQPAFLNAVVRVETGRSPEDLLRTAKEIERELGRQTRARFGPREIDVDLLLYEDERRNTDELTLPHPRMTERPFVQIPLAELTGQTAPASDAVRMVENARWADGA